MWGDILLARRKPRAADERPLRHTPEQLRPPPLRAGGGGSGNVARPPSPISLSTSRSCKNNERTHAHERTTRRMDGWMMGFRINCRLFAIDSKYGAAGGAAAVAGESSKSKQSKCGRRRAQVISIGTLTTTSSTAMRACGTIVLCLAVCSQ